MKAALALLALYVATFLVVVSLSSQNSKAVKPGSSAALTQQSPIDPAKEADIRSLMELVGAKDTIDDAANAAADQYRERLLTSMPDNDGARAFADAFVDKFKAQYNADDFANHVAAAYDKHFTADEIKGLLQFYGSPLGQKTAAEMPKITREIQADTREGSVRVAKEVLQEMKAQNPELGQSARLSGGFGRRRRLPPQEKQ